MKTLRVLTGSNYLVERVVDLGQRNACFTKLLLTPIKHIWPNSISLTLAPPGYDLIHTVNAIPLLGNQPYFISVETFMPRMWPGNRLEESVFEYLGSQLLSKKCKKLLAFSKFAIRTMHNQNRKHHWWPGVSKKIELLYPSVSVKNAYPKKLSGKKIKLLAVGHDFMRKGFPSIAMAHSALKKLNVEIETTIVSSLRWSASDFIGPRCKALYAGEKKRLVSSGVRIISSLPNKDVLRLMQEADFFVFPTLHDAFGFVVTESLSVGTPVIATSTCAIPEIVSDGVNGFLLPIDTDPVTHRWSWFDQLDSPGYTDAYRHQIERSSQNIVDVIQNFLCDTDAYEELSCNALETASTKFHRDAQRKRLETLYDQI